MRLLRLMPLAVGAALTATAILPPDAAGQSPSGTDSVTVRAGDYGANLFHRLFFGSDYRDLWTEPMRVEVLDLDRFAGGLTPTERGGGQQTRSLRLEARDGRVFTFRSVDKDPSPILPPELRETLVDDIVQDQISSAQPVGALVVSPLLDAVGVLHVEPRLRVMPDDPRLGEFREEFAGMLGIIEERADESDSGLAALHGASNVVGTERMLEGLEEDLETFDSRAFLAARLTDLLLGDWDRHEDQWRWARFGEEREDSWKPIPRDRDQAFVRMDGLLLYIARWHYPQFLAFDSGYPDMLGLTWNGRELDRRLLSDLERPVFDSVAVALQAMITDEAIDEAVGRLPPELAPLAADDLRRRLRARRDALPEAARSFFEHLAGEVDIHTTDEDEVADVRHLEGGLEVVVRAPDTDVGSLEIFRRHFQPGETAEVRLYLQGGDDSVRVSGPRGGIGVRVVGGGSGDTFVDEAGGSHFYDEGDASEFVRGPGTTVDTREFEAPEPSPSPLVRDWGTLWRLPAWVLYDADAGVAGGLTLERYAFGFRHVPWKSLLRVRAGWAPQASTYLVDGEFRYHLENSAASVGMHASATGLAILRFHGFGNETELVLPEAAYELEQHQYAFGIRAFLPLAPNTMASVGPTLLYSSTDRPPAWLEGEALPYGMASFGQLGIAAGLDVDRRDRPRAPTSGARLTLDADAYPAVWDAEEAFGSIRGIATAYVTPWEELRPTLAFRVGARKVFGTYPFHEAAFLGDAETVRLGFDQRFAGDAYAHANAELRVRLARPRVVLPMDMGLTGLYDVGRVWLDGEESERWHTAVGGGLWFGFLRPENAVSITVASSDDGTGIYVGGGFAF